MEDNGISNNFLSQALAAEDFYRRMPQKIAKAHVYIKDNELDIKITTIKDTILMEGNDVKKGSEHVSEILKILNDGRETDKIW